MSVGALEKPPEARVAAARCNVSLCTKFLLAFDLQRGTGMLERRMLIAHKHCI